MTNPSFDLVDLRLFVRIATLNSVTKGAADCHMSTPAASVRIRNLEIAFGVKFLERTHSGVVPTPAGQAFLKHAQMVLDQADALTAALHTISNTGNSHLNISANSPSMSETLPRVLSRYRKSYPDIKVNVRTALNKDVPRAVLNGSADLGFYGGDLEIEDIESKTYMQDRFVLITSEEHNLANKSELSMSEVMNYDIIGFPEYSSAYAFISNVVGEKEFANNVRVSVDNYDTLFRMIENNVGVGVISECTARRYARNAPVKIIPLNDPASLLDFNVCAKNFESIHYAGKAFLDILFEEAQSASAHQDAS
jgi:DNA-binding transcriptional LysR family regulator